MANKKATAKPETGSSVRISEEVKVKAKVYVASRRMSLLTLMDEAVLEYLKRHA